MIDFHTHIIPNIDDGSKDLDMSLSMLDTLEKQNVDTVCLTPHYYASEDIDSYLIKRNKQYELLKENYKGNIKLLLGSEVHYYSGISETNDINKLCLGNTNLLLIELPFEPVKESSLKEIIKLSKEKNLKIVLAHIDRYNFKDEELLDLKYKGILLQMNIEVFNDFFNSLKAYKRLELIDFLGTDCHNLSNRKPNYDLGYNKIVKKLGIDYFNNIKDRSYVLLRNYEKKN